jgi:hypothetical protein
LNLRPSGYEPDELLARNRILLLRLPSLPHSPRSNRSLIHVSKIWEYRRMPLETFGRIFDGFRNSGVQRPLIWRRSPATARIFAMQRDQTQSPDWLAGVRGFELTHSRSNPISSVFSGKSGNSDRQICGNASSRSCHKELSGRWRSTPQGLSMLSIRRSGMNQMAATST